MKSVRSKIQKKSQKKKGINHFDINNFLKTGKLEITKEKNNAILDKNKETLIENEDKKDKEEDLKLKSLRIEKELQIINKGLYKNDIKEIFYNQKNENKVQNSNENIIIFPIILETNIGLKQKNFNIEFNNLKFIQLELIITEQITNINYNNNEIGYITKNISELLYLLSKNKFIQILSYLSSENNSKIYIVIILLYNKYGINVKFDEKNKFYYSLSFNENVVLGNNCIKILKKLQNISMLTNNNNLNSNFEEKKNEILNFIYSKDNNNENENEDMSTFSEYLLNNSEKILSIINSYENIFDEKDKQYYNKYISLTKEEKNLLILFMKRTSKWINIKNLNDSPEIILNIITNLINKEFIQIFITDNFEINFSEMFEYLYYFKVDELKYLDNQFSKYAKDSKISNSSNLNKNINEIFINNPFYNLTKYIFPNSTNNLLIDDIIKISKYITSFTFSKEEVKKREDTNIIENTFTTHFNLSKKNKSYNNKYIDNFLNYSNFKKVHLNSSLINLLSSNSGKMFLINKIINEIDTYLLDKRSSFLESFIMNKNINETHNSKIDKIKKIFSIYNMKYFTLNSNFGKLFDITTRLFFFYSDYRDLNSIGKEYYGKEKFEIYKVDNVNKIFSQKDIFQIYDALYQIKNAYNIYALFNNNEINNPISCENILNILFYHLLDNNNSNLLNKIKLTENLIKDENKFKELNKELIKYLNEKYSDKNLKICEQSFINKFNSGNISSQILFYLAQISERNKKFEKSNFIYLFLLNKIENNFILKKRGHIFYRLILNYNHHLKDKITSINILNICIENDINKFNIIKGGYFEKIQNYSEKFSKEKTKPNKKKGKKAIKNTSINYFIDISIPQNPKSKNIKKENKTKIENIENSNIKIKKSKIKFDIKSIIKTIESDSLYSVSTGRRLYSINIGDNDNLKNGISTVEQFALSYYNNEYNYVGIHGENLIIPSLYNLYLWDCIYYDNLPFVFQSPFQFGPLDFYEKEFYIKRKDIIDKQLNLIENFTIENIYEYINNIFDKKKNIKSAFIDWNNYLNNKDIMINISIAMTPKKMVKIFKTILIEGSKFFRRGMPDLFLWKQKMMKKENTNSNYVEAIWDSLKLVEVKSTNDKLSEYQIFWLKLLHDKGIDIEVLHIK